MLMSASKLVQCNLQISGEVKSWLSKKLCVVCVCVSVHGHAHMHRNINHWHGGKNYYDIKEDNLIF